MLGKKDSRHILPDTKNKTQAVSASSGRRVLGWTLVLTLVFCLVEFIGGKLSGSLALVADAGHMLTDSSGIAIALFAAWVVGKRPTPKMSYGYYRLEILAALVNGAILLTIAIFIVKEAFHRLQTIPEIKTNLMLIVAFVGLLVNLLCAFLLGRSSKENINIRGAFFHILGDMLSSIGTLLAGLIIAVTGWYYADPLVSLVIVSLIVTSAWLLLKDVVEVLLEATPRHIDVEKLEKKVLSVSGVEAIHDLHVWSITSGRESLSAHLEVAPGVDSDHLLNLVNEILSKDFRIYHTTLQIESVHKKRQEDSSIHP